MPSPVFAKMGCSMVPVFRYLTPLFMTVDEIVGWLVLFTARKVLAPR